MNDASSRTWREPATPPKRQTRRRSGVAALAVATLLAGCATSDHLYLVDREVHCSFLREPVPFLGELPERPYVAVARVEASSVLVPASWESLRLHLCREAVAVDADAVIDVEREHIVYSIGITPFSLDWTKKRLEAVAIRFIGPGERLEDASAVPALGADGKPVEKEDADPEPDTTVR